MSALFDFEELESGKLTRVQTKKIKDVLLDRFPRITTYKDQTKAIFGKKVGDVVVEIDTRKISELMKIHKEIVSRELRPSYMNSSFANKVNKILKEN